MHKRKIDKIIEKTLDEYYILPRRVLHMEKLPYYKNKLILDLTEKLKQGLVKSNN